MDASAIESLILQAMPDAEVKVDSADNVHFVAHIISESFSNCSRLQRHRQVHDAIGPALGREIHALTLDLKSPEEARG